MDNVIQSLSESFVRINHNNFKVMKSILEESDIPMSNDIGYPVYTFSDESWIMFHGKDFTIASPRKSNENQIQF